MNFWEKFLRITYKLAAYPFLNRYQRKSIEVVLRKSTTIIDADIQVDIKKHILKSFTQEGGFADRAGKPDIYYSLFGYFIAETFSLDELFPKLKIYVKKVASCESLIGINLYCCAILYSKLFGFDSTTEKLRKQVEDEFARLDSKNYEYSLFFGMLTLFYLQGYQNLLKLKNRIKRVKIQGEIPCSVAAADAVVNNVIKPQNNDTILKSFYRDNGGFVALQKAPVADLLSTAVALYALHFIGSDLKSIKPDCLSFIDKLYLNGGFCATELDFDIDVEYTFYGMLALGALAE